MQCSCKCNSLFTSFPSHQVSISTHMHSVHFSAFSMHYAQCTSCPWRHTNTRRITNITQQRGSVAPAAIYCARIGTLAPDKIGRKCWKVEILLVHTYPTTSPRPRGRCVQSLVHIGSEMWICLSSIQTNKQTFIFIYNIYVCINTRNYKLTLVTNYGVCCRAQFVFSVLLSRIRRVPGACRSYL